MFIFLLQCIEFWCQHFWFKNRHNVAFQTMHECQLRLTCWWKCRQWRTCLAIKAWCKTGAGSHELCISFRHAFILWLFVGGGEQRVPETRCGRDWEWRSVSCFLRKPDRQTWKFRPRGDHWIFCFTKLVMAFVDTSLHFREIFDSSFRNLITFQEMVTICVRNLLCFD